MSYLDELADKVNEVFDKAKDQEDLQDRVLSLVKDIAKESFKNGL